MRRSVKYGLYGAVLAGVTAAATAAFATTAVDRTKTVRLVVDGTVHTVSTESGDVAGLLSQAGYRVDSHDLVAPGVHAALGDHETVVLKRGRMLHLSIDGRARTVWTTARTVSGALDALGYSNSDYVSVSRSTRLPLDPMSLRLRKPKHLVLVHDHTRQRITTTDATVRGVLADAGVHLREMDRLSPAKGTAITDHMRIVVQRVHSKLVVKHRSIAYQSHEREDPSLYTGLSSVATYGHEGRRELVYRVVFVDGKRVSSTLVSRSVVRRPVDKVVNVGTKQRPKPKPKPTPPPTPPSSPSPTPPPDTSGLNWDAVADCESGGDWSINTGNGYYGGLQFSLSTWDSEGGTAYAERPDLASREQQIAIATKLYNVAGSSPWPVCGAYL